MSEAMTAERMRAFAREWVDNWNRRDVAAVVSHLHKDATFVSPLAIRITGSREVRGWQALDDYWRRASAEAQGLRFELLETVCDVSAQTLVVSYKAESNGTIRSAVEIMRFSDGWQVSGEALYGAPF